MSWKTDKRLTFVNRGLETHLAVTEMGDMPGAFRVVRHEKAAGDIKTKVFEQIFDSQKAAYEVFHELAIDTLEVQFTHPDGKGARIVARFDDLAAADA